MSRVLAVMPNRVSSVVGELRDVSFRIMKNKINPFTITARRGRSFQMAVMEHRYGMQTVSKPSMQWFVLVDTVFIK